MEKLYIGNDICVTVVRLEGGQVRLGIEAPREIPIVRAELRGGPEAEQVPVSSTHPAEPVTTRPASAPGTDTQHLGPA
jgi:carbon storage regulator